MYRVSPIWSGWPCTYSNHGVGHDKRVDIQERCSMYILTSRVGICKDTPDGWTWVQVQIVWHWTSLGFMVRSSFSKHHHNADHLDQQPPWLLKRNYEVWAAQICNNSEWKRSGDAEVKRKTNKQRNRHSFQGAGTGSSVQPYSACTVGGRYGRAMYTEKKLYREMQWLFEVPEWEEDKVVCSECMMKRRKMWRDW